MKRKAMMRGLVLVLGLLALGCGGDGSGGTPAGGGGVVLTGTKWINTEVASVDTLSFTSDTEWNETNGSTTIYGGTYTVSGTTVTISTDGMTGKAEVTGDTMNFFSGLNKGWSYTKKSDGSGGTPGGSGGTPGDSTPPASLSGTTWKGVNSFAVNAELRFISSGSWQIWYSSGLYWKGTYQYSGSNISLIVKEVSYNGSAWTLLPVQQQTAYSGTVTSSTSLNVIGINFTKQ